VEVKQTQGNAMKLCMLHHKDVRLGVQIAYNLQTVTVWMFLKVIPGVAILEIWHYDERFVI
jgi:hypothetical protein